MTKSGALRRFFIDILLLTVIINISTGEIHGFAERRENMDNMDLMNPRQIPAGCTKKEYRRSYASPELYKQLRTWAIVGYVLCGISLLVSWVDAVFMAVMVLLMHLKRMKWPVFAILANAALGAVLSLMAGGGLTGWAWFVVVIGALNVFKKIDAEYEQIKANSADGNTPM